MYRKETFTNLKELSLSNISLMENCTPISDDLAVQVETLTSDLGAIKKVVNSSEFTIKGDFRDHYAFILIEPRSNGFILNGDEHLEPLVVFAPVGWNYALKFPAHYEDTVILWEKASFEETLNINQMSDLTESSQAIFWKGCSEVPHLRNNLNSLLNSDISLNAVLKECADIFLDFYLTNKEVKENLSDPKIALLAFDYMKDFCHADISVGDICSNLRVSRRTLEVVYKKTFGVSPNKHFRMVKLYRIRRELLNSSPGEKQILDILQNFNVSHAGHYGQFYKTHFGETMSETLKDFRNPFNN